MVLTFKRTRRGRAIWLAAFKGGYHVAFTQGPCFDAKHANATEKRLTAWSRQGWPYIVKDI